MVLRHLGTIGGTSLSLTEGNQVEVQPKCSRDAATSDLAIPPGPSINPLEKNSDVFDIHIIHSSLFSGRRRRCFFGLAATSNRHTQGRPDSDTADPQECGSEAYKSSHCRGRFCGSSVRTNSSQEAARFRVRDSSVQP